MTAIAQQNGKWYVVKDGGLNNNMHTWIIISPSFNTSYEAREYQLDLIMGRV